MGEARTDEHGNPLRQCDQCAEWIKERALICRHCDGQAAGKRPEKKHRPTAPKVTSRQSRVKLRLAILMGVTFVGLMMFYSFVPRIARVTVVPLVAVAGVALFIASRRDSA